MRFLIKIFTGMIKIAFAIIKLFPIQNKITIASRQSDTKSMDIKMLKEEIEKQRPDIKVVCLCRTLGGSASHMIGYGFHLIRQLWHIGTSKAVVVDSYCIGVSVPKQREETVIIQMWHALGALKKFGFSIAGETREGRSKEVADGLNMHKNYTYVLTSGECCVGAYQEAFGYERENIIVAPLPRVDAITDSSFIEKTGAAIYEKYPELNGEKVIVYAPTFRKEKDISKEVLQLADEAAEKGFTLIVKKHPLMNVNFDNTSVLEAKEFSTLEMLTIADYVICDYSAIVFEAALMKKPLYFYAFDLEEYEGARDFYINYREEMPGIIEKDPAKLIDEIERENHNIERIKEFAAKYISRQSECASAIAELILKEIDKSGSRL